MFTSNIEECRKFMKFFVPKYSRASKKFINSCNNSTLHSATQSAWKAILCSTPCIFDNKIYLSKIVSKCATRKIDNKVVAFVEAMERCDKWLGFNKSQILCIHCTICNFNSFFFVIGTQSSMLHFSPSQRFNEFSAFWSAHDSIHRKYSLKVVTVKVCLLNTIRFATKKTRRSIHLVKGNILQIQPSLAKKSSTGISKSLALRLKGINWSDRVWTANGHVNKVSDFDELR